MSSPRHSKKILKRDATTRVRAASALKALVADKPKADVVAAISHFIFCFSQLQSDSRHQVRFEIASCLGAFASRVAPKLRLYLKAAAVPWWYAIHDTERRVRKAANDAFLAAFPGEKYSAAVEFCAAPVLRAVHSRLAALNVKGKNASTTIAKSVAEASVRIMSTLVKTLSTEYLRRITSTDSNAKALTVCTNEIVTKLAWKLLASGDDVQRKLCYHLASSISQRVQDMTSICESSKFVPTFVSLALRERSATNMSEMWYAMVALITSHPRQWEGVDFEKGIFPRIQSLLESRVCDPQAQMYSYLLPLMKILPRAEGAGDFFSLHRRFVALIWNSIVSSNEGALPRHELVAAHGTCCQHLLHAWEALKGGEVLHAGLTALEMAEKEILQSCFTAVKWVLESPELRRGTVEAVGRFHLACFSEGGIQINSAVVTFMEEMLTSAHVGRIGPLLLSAKAGCILIDLKPAAVHLAARAVDHLNKSADLNAGVTQGLLSLCAGLFSRESRIFETETDSSALDFPKVWDDYLGMVASLARLDNESEAGIWQDAGRLTWFLLHQSSDPGNLRRKWQEFLSRCADFASDCSGGAADLITEVLGKCEVGNSFLWCGQLEVFIDPHRANSDDWQRVFFAAMTKSIMPDDFLSTTMSKCAETLLQELKNWYETSLPSVIGQNASSLQQRSLGIVRAFLRRPGVSLTLNQGLKYLCSAVTSYGLMSILNSYLPSGNARNEFSDDFSKECGAFLRAYHQPMVEEIGNILEVCRVVPVNDSSQWAALVSDFVDELPPFDGSAKTDTGHGNSWMEEILLATKYCDQGLVDDQAQAYGAMVQFMHMRGPLEFLTSVGVENGARLLKTYIEQHALRCCSAANMLSVQDWELFYKDYFLPPVRHLSGYGKQEFLSILKLLLDESFAGGELCLSYRGTRVLLSTMFGVDKSRILQAKKDGLSGVAVSQDDVDANMENAAEETTNSEDTSKAEETGNAQSSALEFKRGDSVLYNKVSNGNGSKKHMEAAIIMAVHSDDTGAPYYTIRVASGGEKQTEAKNLVPLVWGRRKLSTGDNVADEEKNDLTTKVARLPRRRRSKQRKMKLSTRDKRDASGVYSSLCVDAVRRAFSNEELKILPRTQHMIRLVLRYILEKGTMGTSFEDQLGPLKGSNYVPVLSTLGKHVVTDGERTNNEIAEILNLCVSSFCDKGEGELECIFMLHCYASRNMSQLANMQEAMQAFLIVKEQIADFARAAKDFNGLLRLRETLLLVRHCMVAGLEAANLTPTVLIDTIGALHTFFAETRDTMQHIDILDTLEVASSVLALLKCRLEHLPIMLRYIASSPSSILRIHAYSALRDCFSRIGAADGSLEDHAKDCKSSGDSITVENVFHQIVGDLHQHFERFQEKYELLSSPGLSLSLLWCLFCSHRQYFRAKHTLTWVEKMCEANLYSVLLPLLFQTLESDGCFHIRALASEAETMSSFVASNLWSTSISPLSYLCGRALVEFAVAFPSLLRQWWLELPRGARKLVWQIHEKEIAPLVATCQLAKIKKTKEADADEDMHYIVGPAQVTASYEKDDCKLEIVIVLPPAFPLEVASITCPQRFGIKESRWQRLLLRIKSLLRDGDVYNAVDLWKRNVDDEFDGVESCPICYCTLHAVDNTLPRVKCETCKNLFHSACLYKWFSSAPQSTCPLCRSPF